MNKIYLVVAPGIRAIVRAAHITAALQAAGAGSFGDAFEIDPDAVNVPYQDAERPDCILRMTV
jgi:hypothetical protein